MGVTGLQSNFIYKNSLPAHLCLTTPLWRWPRNNTPADGLWTLWLWVPVQRSPSWPCRQRPLAKAECELGEAWIPEILVQQTGPQTWNASLMTWWSQERKNLAYDNPLPFWGFFHAQLKLIPIHKWSQARNIYFVESVFFRPFTNQNDV